MTATPASFASVPGTSYSGTVATFTDSNPADSASTFAATITWDDGSQTPASAISANADGSFSVQAVSPAYATAGAHPYTVTITGPSGETATAQGTANVAELILTPQSFSAGQNLAFSNVVVASLQADATLHRPQRFFRLDQLGRRHDFHRKRHVSSRPIRPAASSSKGATPMPPSAPTASPLASAAVDPVTGNITATTTATGTATVQVASLTVTAESFSSVVDETYTGTVAQISLG